MTTMMIKLSSVLLVTLGVAHANKDNQMYGNNATNPNVNNPMYWKDATNVLEDLSMFSKLYVEYHGCAWTPIEIWQPSGGQGGNMQYYQQNQQGQYYQQNQQGQQQQEGDQQQQQAREGQYALNTDSWYMGRTETRRANVAFSLYGVLAGQEDEGCSKNTFINSFFTSAGLESYLQAFRADGLFEDVSVNNQCMIFDSNNENADGWTGVYGYYNFAPNANGYYSSYKGYANYQGNGNEEMDEAQMQWYSQQQVSGGWGYYKQYSSNANGNADEAQYNAANPDEEGYNKYVQYGNNKYANYGQNAGEEAAADEGQGGQGNYGQGGQGNYDYNGRLLYSHGEEKYAGYSSKSVACSNGNFVVKQFDGAFCSADKAGKTVDKMTVLNRQLNRQQCYPIYVSQYAYGNNNGNNNADGNNGNNDNAAKDIASNLLPYSKACSTYEYPNLCPDPYGKVNKYEKALFKATEVSPGNGENGDKLFISLILLVTSGMMIWAAVNFKPKAESELREASSFARSISTAASQASSKFEATRSFLQAENDGAEESDEDSVMVEKPMEEAATANKDVADTMLGEQKKKRRFKRPILARLSMLVMGRKRNKASKVSI